MLRVAAGHRYAQLTVVVRDGSSRDHKALWRCRCDCGTETVVRSTQLTQGKTRSCGCLLRRSRHKATNLQHGDARPGRQAPEYLAWIAMRVRCTNPKAQAWRRYGGRGIQVCERWMWSYEAFLADVGRRPSPKHSIDRIDNDGHYEPGNVRWATRSQQNANQRSRPRLANGTFAAGRIDRCS